MICPNCKSNIPDDTILCPNCSYNVPAASIDDSVLGNVKEYVNKKIPRNSRKGVIRSPYEKYMVIICFVFLLLELAMFLYIIPRTKNYIDYDGKLVEYAELDGKYTGIYEFKSNNKKQRITYNKYYYSKEEVPDKVIISKRNENKINLNPILFPLIIFVPFIFVLLIDRIFIKKYRKMLSDDYGMSKLQK